MKRALNVQESAKYLGVSRVTIHRLLKRGLLHAHSDPLNLRVRLIPFKELVELKRQSEDARKGVKIA